MRLQLLWHKIQGPQPSSLTHQPLPMTKRMVLARGGIPISVPPRKVHWFKSWKTRHNGWTLVSLQLTQEEVFESWEWTGENTDDADIDTSASGSTDTPLDSGDANDTAAKE